MDEVDVTPGSFSRKVKAIASQVTQVTVTIKFPPSDSDDPGRHASVWYGRGLGMLLPAPERFESDVLAEVFDGKADARVKDGKTVCVFVAVCDVEDSRVWDVYDFHFLFLDGDRGSRG